MSEQNTLTPEHKKTIGSFIAGLLIGGLLVFIFAMPSATEKTTLDPETETSDETTVPAATSSDRHETATSVPTASGTTSDTTTRPTGQRTSPSVITGAGAITVANQPASNQVVLTSVEYPATSGWIGVRDYENGRPTGLLGVSRWDVADGLLPKTVSLLRRTEAGKSYAVVFYSDNGDRTFSVATDAQIGDTLETFTAQ